MRELAEFVERLFDRVERFIRRVLNIEREKQPPPNAPYLFFEEGNMSDVRVRVSWPLTRAGGRPLPLTEIAKADVQVAVVDQPEMYGGDRELLPDGNPHVEFVQTELEAGSWFFRARVVDTEGRKSAWKTAEVVVDGELTSPDSPLVELTLEDPA